MKDAGSTFNALVIAGRGLGERGERVTTGTALPVATGSVIFDEK